LAGITSIVRDFVEVVGAICRWMSFVRFAVVGSRLKVCAEGRISHVYECSRAARLRRGLLHDPDGLGLKSSANVGV